MVWSRRLPRTHGPFPGSIFGFGGFIAVQGCRFTPSWEDSPAASPFFLVVLCIAELTCCTENEFVATIYEVGPELGLAVK